MNNQWGRSGNGPGASSGIGGVLFASVVCLALGAAAGYGAFRMMDGTIPASELEARDQRIADLARELDTRVAQVEQSSQKSQALAEENGALKREVETLRSSADTPGAAVATAENVRLTQQVVPELRNKLELAEQRLADAQALRTRAEAAVRDRERQLSLRADQIAQLENTLDQVRGRQNTAQNAETERLRSEADALRRNLAEVQRSEEALRTKDLAALRDQIARRDEEIARLNARNAALTTRVSALETAARSTQPSKPADSGDEPVRDNTQPDEGRNPRNAALVTQAMQDTPGLDRLTSAQRQQLERTLISGECVTNALGGVFKRVPVLALRNLMRDLDSDC